MKYDEDGLKMPPPPDAEPPGCMLEYMLGSQPPS